MTGMTSFQAQRLGAEMRDKHTIECGGHFRSYLMVLKQRIDEARFHHQVAGTLSDTASLPEIAHTERAIRLSLRDLLMHRAKEDAAQALKYLYESTKESIQPTELLRLCLVVFEEVFNPQPPSTLEVIAETLSALGHALKTLSDRGLARSLDSA